VAVDEVNSVSGMLAPGDRIDLLFSTRPPRTDGRAATEVTAPLMQDLLILATGQLTERQRVQGQTDRNGAFTSITVAVTPDQAQRLVLAQRSGRLTALLRNPTDRREQQAGPMDVYKLLGLDRPGQPKRSQIIGPQVIVGGLGPINTAEVGVASPAGARGQYRAPGRQEILTVRSQQVSQEVPVENN
jgi:pilus assembly protein CpaB